MTNTLSKSQPHSVLVVDDEPGVRTALQANFLRHGWNVQTASGIRDAAAAIERGSFDLVVSDIRMRDGDGFEVMTLVRKDSPSTAVILLTAFGSVPEAVKSMRGGAFDYLTKPVSFDQLQATAARVMQRAVAIDAGCPMSGFSDMGSASSFTSTAPVETVNSGIIGRSPLLLQTLHRARAAASTGADVLVEAESGTGKELIARFIHDASDRADKPFVAVNCAAIPEHLIESELFGHARGAFTGASATKIGKFEMANGGTLLLDEIGEMPLHLQPKLLRVLQEREFERLGETRSIRVDIRVIATTNAVLGAMVDQGRFRSDLYYRLNVIPLSIPALRDRAEDIPSLATHFAARFAAENNCAVPALDASFLHELQGHAWPGNVRELGNFMRRVLSLHRGVTLNAAYFQQEFKPLTRAQITPHAMPPAGTRISEIEKLHLENTLALAHGNRTHAAEMLGISLRTVRNKIKEYGLPPRTYLRTPAVHPLMNRSCA
ncbi:MAG: sigma-54 dependent transcriptional regulator [Acidobacteriota bacterium]|nr:sigma-54 dependent transcriptional regulator [Acidobacteriota bacterium]